MKQHLILVFALSSFAMLSGQDTIMPLWPKGKIPNQKISDEKEEREVKDIVLVKNVQEPTIEVYLPSERNATGEAMLIFPGGGYYVLAYDWEGTDIAKWLNTQGIAGIVVKYRLPRSKSLKEPHKAPLQDAQRAIRMVRANAEKWHIKADKIGTIGFSAGGHLNAALSVHYDETFYSAIDRIDTFSARPGFSVLLYPLISFVAPFNIKTGSSKALLGEKPLPELSKYFSSELHVTKDTPPTFLCHASDDKGVPVENSLLFYKALRENNVNTSLHIYNKGGHGFSLALDNPYVGQWKNEMVQWLKNL